MAHSEAAGAPQDLAWIGRLFSWGPVRWPLAWCDLIGIEHGDCGVHAAVAELALKGRGLTCRRVQLALGRSTYYELETWRRLWERAGVPSHWVGETWTYHEAVAVGDRAIEVLDATHAIRWTNPVPDGILAIRIEPLDSEDISVTWNAEVVDCGRWVNLNCKVTDCHRAD
jgi:hypothetical protein